MKIDYLNIKNLDGKPFVRLYEFQRKEAQTLKQTFEALATGSLQHVELQMITLVESVDGTKLNFTLNTTDQGVIQIGPQQFDFAMSSRGWRQVAGLTDAFCHQAYMQGFQWLAECASASTELLLSPGGEW